MKNEFDKLQKAFPRAIVKTLRLPLPLPTVLKRKTTAVTRKEFEGATFKWSAFGTSKLKDGVLAFLAENGANFAESEKCKGLLFDASLMKKVEDLDTIYDFFHFHVRSIEKCGRIVLITKKPSEKDTAETKSVLRSIEGIARTFAKELGGKGITAQTITIEDNLYGKELDLKNKLNACLHFLLSDYSSFITTRNFELSAVVEVKSFKVDQALEGKIALVTGGSQGIGEATVRALSREGAKCIILDIPQAKENAEKLAKEVNAEVLLMDVTADDAPNQIQAYVKKQHGGLDILINNAGITKDKTIANMSKDFWQRCLQVNLASVARITDKLMEDGLNNGGRIVGLSSISGIAGNVGQSNYAASKAGMIGLMQAYAELGAKKGITANALAPGYIETKMTQNLPFFVKEGGRRLSALKQGGLPYDIAEGIRFLSSPGAAGVTAQVVRVCGGSFIGA